MLKPSLLHECPVPDNQELARLSAAGNALNLPFTGERVVPGVVEPQLWNEHIARYRFANQFGKGRDVLDAGCGTGYGTELLARSARYTLGFDSSLDAIRYATASYSSASYIAGSASSFPIGSASFDVVTAFEIIEHLENWEALLQEAARVLRPDGVLLVSTPNTEYYAEARGPSGPNPFHIHEFNLTEFDAALRRVFSFVQILAQNQQETVTFSDDRSPQATSCFIPPIGKLDDAHFFVAVCSFRPVTVSFFADVASSHNLLREREIHIRGLQGELAVARAEYAELLEVYDRLANELAGGQANDEEQLQSLSTEQEENRRELAALQLELSLVRHSTWIRLGRFLGVGPWSDHRLRIRGSLGRNKVRARGAANRGKEWLSRLTERLRKSPESCRQLAGYLASPLLVGATAITLAVVDICFAIAGKKEQLEDQAPSCRAASVVIPSWNGLHFLEANLPALMSALSGLPESEVIVVDNGSTDGTVAFLRENYPEIRLLELTTNEGFGSACNRGAQVARHDIVVFLNNDMEVDRGFLPRLLKNFSDPLVFAVSSQIFLANPYSVREETGLTEVWWEGGQLGVGHRIDPCVTTTFPCAYPGGGSSAFDRKKFLLLGGFDHLFQPFYYEDTDLGYLAWKRGWKVLYEPSSIVHHRHRGTIGKTFSSDYISSVVRQNAALYCWKNLHDWRFLGDHLRSCLTHSLANGMGATQRRPIGPIEVRHAFSKLVQVAASRWRAHSLRRISDREAFLRPQPGYYRDRFLPFPARSPERLNVLFVSPYPIEPPTHGGAVFMRETIRGLNTVANVHVISFLDREEQREAQQALQRYCASALFIVRPHLCLDDQWTLVPNAIREFGIRDLAWAIQRTILLQNIDVVQLEYTTMGQYAGAYRNIPCVLFEHDISSQSLWRRIRAGQWDLDLLLEYFRMRLYEPRLLRRVTSVQVCSEANAFYLRGLVREPDSRIVSNVRASIDVGSYGFRREGRELGTLLFLGSFRHLPNREGLRWFVSEVLPQIIAERPQTILYIAGSDASRSAAEWKMHPSIRFLGTIEDVKDALSRFSVFVCPVLSGSGVRVKLLEAFASGIPAVSTTVGAEGLSAHSDLLCEIADTPSDFARVTLGLLTDRERGNELAGNARRYVEQYRDSRQMTALLEASYRTEVERLRGSRIDSPPLNPEPAPLVEQSHA